MKTEKRLSHYDLNLLCQDGALEGNQATGNLDLRANYLKIKDSRNDLEMVITLSMELFCCRLSHSR